MKKPVSTIALIILSSVLALNVNAATAKTKVKTIAPVAEVKPPAEEAALPDPNAEVVKKIATAFMENNNVPGVAIELYVDGKPHEYYFGYANPEQKTPIEKKTIFEIGSISKVMTGLLFAQEIDYAKMSLNDPVSKYVKGLPPTFDKIKLQDLATHASGLPLSLPANIKTKEALNSYLLQWTPSVQPGQEWIYSSVGLGLLGMALENSTTMDFDKLYRRHILNAIGMVTGVAIPPKLQKYAAQGHDSEGKPVGFLNDPLFPAASAIKASASDMQKFLSAAIGLPGTSIRVFYPMRLTQSAFLKLPYRQQGLGWEIYSLNQGSISDLLHVPEHMDMGPITIQEIYERPAYNGDALLDKTGQTNGFRAYIAVIPNKKSGIVILSNKVVSNRAIVQTGRQILFHVTKLAKASV